MAQINPAERTVNRVALRVVRNLISTLVTQLEEVTYGSKDEHLRVAVKALNAARTAISEYQYKTEGE